MTNKGLSSNTELIHRAKALRKIAEQLSIFEVMEGYNFSKDHKDGIVKGLKLAFNLVARLQEKREIDESS